MKMPNCPHCGTELDADYHCSSCGYTGGRFSAQILLGYQLDPRDVRGHLGMKAGMQGCFACGWQVRFQVCYLGAHYRLACAAHLIYAMENLRQEAEPGLQGNDLYEVRDWSRSEHRDPAADEVHKPGPVEEDPR